MFLLHYGREKRAFSPDLSFLQKLHPLSPVTERGRTMSNLFVEEELAKTWSSYLKLGELRSSWKEFAKTGYILKNDACLLFLLLKIKKVY